MENISVIIPVYNAEKTIRRCLDSIINSKYEDYEVILIDDGSTDNSAAIISEYANNDKRIKNVSQLNSGPSSARNKGLELSQGKIIAFVDSDDYVRDDYLEQLANAFEREKADVVFLEFHRVTSDGAELSVHELPEIQQEYHLNLVALSEKDMFGYTWIKAFRREVLHNVFFDVDMNLFEDEIFTCKILEKAVKLYYLKEAVYFYVQADGTLVQRTHKDYCQLCDRVYRAWEKLLSTMPDSVPFLERKANHMARVCKYYGLERKVNPFVFYREMESADFMKYVTLCDPMITAVKEKKWCKVAWMHLKYNAKVILNKHIVRKIK